MLWQMIHDKTETVPADADDRPPRIYPRDAELLDVYIFKLCDLHKHVLRREFYLRSAKDRPGILEVGAAERALQDVIDAGRR
jgi:hypothetical protein